MFDEALNHNYIDDELRNSFKYVFSELSKKGVLINLELSEITIRENRININNTEESYVGKKIYRKESS